MKRGLEDKLVFAVRAQKVKVRRETICPAEKLPFKKTSPAAERETRREDKGG